MKKHRSLNRKVKNHLLSLLLFTSSLMVTACNDTNDSNVFNDRLSTVSQWNELMLSAIRNGNVRPTVITRQMLIVSAAMYDAWSAYDSVATPYALAPSLRRPAAEHNEANRQAAVSQAAYHALITMFPHYESDTGHFKEYLNKLGYQTSNSQEGISPASIGHSAALANIAARNNDGSNASGDYADTVSTRFPTLYAAVNSANPNANSAIGGTDFDPNQWTPIRVPNGTLVDSAGLPLVDNNTPSTYDDQTFLTPHWGAVTPFALSRGNQFRPSAPPMYGSAVLYTDALGRTMSNDQAWHQQVDEVLAASAALTEKQKVIAEFWADGPRSESPPGHWNQLAHGISIRDAHSIGQDVKMFFALNGALLDAGISTWEAKRVYDFIRPVTAIKFKYAGQTIQAWGGPDQGTQAIDGSDWRPYQDVTFVTPPFPEFTSGHSGFSRASAEVLTAFTGSSQFFDGTTTTGQDVNGDGKEDLLGEHIQAARTNLFEFSPPEEVVLRWDTFYEAADEAGVSRIYGGIHIQDGNIRGLELGEKVGQQAYRLAEQYWNGEISR